MCMLCACYNSAWSWLLPKISDRSRGLIEVVATIQGVVIDISVPSQSMFTLYRGCVFESDDGHLSFCKNNLTLNSHYNFNCTLSTLCCFRDIFNSFNFLNLSVGSVVTLSILQTIIQGTIVGLMIVTSPSCRAKRQCWHLPRTSSCLLRSTRRANASYHRWRNISIKCQFVI